MSHGLKSCVLRIENGVSGGRKETQDEKDVHQLQGWSQQSRMLRGQLEGLESIVCGKGKLFSLDTELESRLRKMVAGDGILTFRGTVEVRVK